MSEHVTFNPIGTVRSQHTVASDTPIQPVFSPGCSGTIELLPEYQDGLDDIDGFSHIIVLYYFHRAGPPSLRVTPFLDDISRGVFATRHPCRPNPIGFSILRLVGREGTTLRVESVDILDGTPVLDVKPFLPQCDTVENARGGWMEDVPEGSRWQRGRRGYHDREATRRTRDLP